MGREPLLRECDKPRRDPHMETQFLAVQNQYDGVEEVDTVNDAAEVEDEDEIQM